jgi:hypothetical protein
VYTGKVVVRDNPTPPSPIEIEIVIEIEIEKNRSRFNNVTEYGPFQKGNTFLYGISNSETNLEGWGKFSGHATA